MYIAIVKRVVLIFVNALYESPFFFFCQAHHCGAFYSSNIVGAAAGAVWPQTSGTLPKYDSLISFSRCGSDGGTNFHTAPFNFRFFFNPCRHRPEHSYELFAQLLASVLPLPWRYGTACTLETSPPPPPPIVKTLKWLTLLHTLTKSHSGWGQRSIRHSLPFPQLWDVPRQYLSAVSSPLDMF